MIIKGNRRGGATQLATHLLRRDTNETVIIREIEGYPQKHFVDQDLKAALSFMAAQGEAKGKSRTLYHSVLAPQEGEVLSQKQLRHAVDTLAKNLGLEGHQRVVVEHHKDGRQHFHVVFSILHPDTGKQARLQWTRKKEWNTGRQLEKELGLKPVPSKGRSTRQWEHQRGKRSGIHPQKVRGEVTAIYHASKSGKEFVVNLAKAGYVLTKGNRDQYVLVDKAGDIHGLLRRIEGVKLKDLKQKFPDLKDMPLPSLESVRKRSQSDSSTSDRKKTGKSGRDKGRIRGGGGSSGKGSGNFGFKNRPVVVSPDDKPVTQSRTASIAPLRIPVPVRPFSVYRQGPANIQQSFRAAAAFVGKDRRSRSRGNEPEKFFNPDSGPMSRGELIAYAWANGRYDILAAFGIFVDLEL